MRDAKEDCSLRDWFWSHSTIRLACAREHQIPLKMILI
jgi:hypothetical protein